MRKLLVNTFGVLWLVLLFALFFPLLWVWPTYRWRTNVARVCSRLLSRGILWVAGIRLEIEGREHLETRPAVLLFNHTNMLDFFVCASFTPRDTLVFGKRALFRIPFLGWLWYFSGHPMIARREPGQWKAVLDGVAARLSTGRYRTFMAPEGTRSRTGELLPFKKGPFHIALTSRAAVVPVVLLDVAAHYEDRRGLLPGALRVKVLPPVATTGWTAERLDEHVAEVRDLYLRELEGARALA